MVIKARLRTLCGATRTIEIDHVLPEITLPLQRRVHYRVGDTAMTVSVPHVLGQRVFRRVPGERPQDRLCPECGQAETTVLYVEADPEVR